MSNNEQLSKFEKARILFTSILEFYNSKSCQCAFPRFHQIVSIDCTKFADSFVCHDTELFINLSNAYFDIENSGYPGNEIWTCKKCRTSFYFNWTDFSIHISRQTLQLKNQNVKNVGKDAVKPIPIYLGISGHSIPSKSEITTIDYDKFQDYMMEQL